MEEEGRRMQSAPPTPLGVAVLNVTRLHSGVGCNIIPDRCSVTVNRRIVATEIAADVRRQLEMLATTACPLPLHTDVLHEVDAFYQSPDAPLVRKLADWSGHAPTVAPFCTNAWAYTRVAEQCAVIGPGSIEQAHGDVEWVDISQLEKLAAIFSRWWGIQ
jgi:acetylornithine deacetylase/succinyl-diaminopimelate desuccinylase-like protein